MRPKYLISIQVKCDPCNGHGKISTIQNGYNTGSISCADCKGTGYVVAHVSLDDLKEILFKAA